MQKNCHCYWTIALFLFCFFFHALADHSSETNEDQAFYATTSLTVHLKDPVSDLSKNPQAHLNNTHFQDSDMAYLWSQVSNLFPFYYPNFDNNPLINEEMRKEIRPYLLPLHHPLKASLDQIFQESRAIQNETSFIEAGFMTLYHQPFSRIRVAKHANLPGYLVKAYLDSDPYKVRKKACWWRLMQRCKGAKNLRKLIKAKKLVHFTVPNKWLYPLPSPSLSSTHPHSFQPVILVVTDMDIVSLHESAEAWKTKITYQHLDELYCILSHGFASEYLSINIPYCKNGQFACVDTEYSKKELDLEHVKNFLSPEMHPYWEELIRKEGN